MSFYGLSYRYPRAAVDDEKKRELDPHVACGTRLQRIDFDLSGFCLLVSTCPLVFFRGQQASAFLACGATDGIFYWRLFANKKWLGWA